MKKVLLVCSILAAFLFTHKAEAQVRVGINFNINSQPAWGPTGYDYVDYYYLPDIDIYYNVPRHQYVYFDDGRWIFSRSIPYQYRSFDFYHAHKVVLNEPTPYLRNDEIRARYSEYRGRREEQHIYNNQDERYRNYYRGNRRTQPEPPQESREGRHDNGEHRGENNDHGNNGEHRGRGNHGD